MQPPAPVKVKHSPSDESLFQDFKHVLNAPDEVISRVIGARPKQDREELKRILGHLPAVRARRGGGGAGGHTRRAPQPPVVQKLNMEAALGSAAPPTPMSARSVSYSDSARMSPGSARGPASSRGSATPRGLIQRVATPRVGGAASTPRAGVVAAPEMLLLGGSEAPTTPIMQVKSASERLAELGIDPAGMNASDLLRTYYARREQTTNKVANSAAEQRLNIRAQTPKSFEGVFTKQAHQEVRHARHAVPITDVHQSLDKWEVDILAEVCRSIRYFDEENKGGTTEYMRHFAKRTYGSVPDRKIFVRKPV